MKPPLEMQVPGWLFHSLQNDPAFRVLTMDGLSWIDPYSGAVVPAPFGYEEVAKKFLCRHKPWNRTAAKKLEELLVLRWFHYLRENLESIPTLRIFQQGMWLNPYRGVWANGITLENNKVTLKTIEDMATSLAATPEAQTGKMIEIWRIDRLVAEGAPGAIPARPTAGRAAKPAVAKPIITQPAPPTPGRSVAPLPSPAGSKLSRTTDFFQIKQMLVKMLARPPRIPGLQTIVHYEPHSAISRDFYDIIPVDEQHLLLVIGDINGQGPGSALMVASTLKALRQIVKEKSDLIGIVCALSDQVRPDLLLDCQITLFAAILDTLTHKLDYLSAGHHPALLLNKDRETPMQQLGGQGEPLGKSNSDNFRRSLRPVQLQLEGGDILLMYSDGLFKVANQKHEEFGKFRLLASCVGNLDKPCSGLVEQVLKDAKDHAHHKLSEDMTVVALRVKEAGHQSDTTSFNETWLGQTPLS